MRFALLHDGKFYPFEADSIEEGELEAWCIWFSLEYNCGYWIPKKEVTDE